jgi:hypothetical protein
LTKPHHDWVVAPHGPLTQINEDIWTAQGEVKTPAGAITRRMTIVRTPAQELIIFSAIALDDAAMGQVEGLGRPAFLVVPSDLHRLDAGAYKGRYPALRVIAPMGAREKVEKVVAIDCMHVDFGDPNISFVTIAGTHDHEAALLVRRSDGLTLIVNDIIGNIHGEHGFGGLMLRLMKFAGDEPHIPSPVKAKIVSNKKALRDQLLTWEAVPDLKRIVVSHGDIIEDDPQRVLRDLAATLN